MLLVRSPAQLEKYDIQSWKFIIGVAKDYCMCEVGSFNNNYSMLYCYLFFYSDSVVTMINLWAKYFGNNTFNLYCLKVLYIIMTLKFWIVAQL